MRSSVGLYVVETSRAAHLDGLRGLAALNVVISHAVVAFDFALYNGSPAMSHGDWDIAASAWPFLLPVAGANFSVCVFFVLSGFVLARSYALSPLGAPAHVVKRYVRLGVPIFLTTLISWALLHCGLMQNVEAATVTRSSWLASQMAQQPDLNAALYEGAVGGLLAGLPFTHSYNSSLWTMPIEFVGSLILIGCFAIGRRAGAFGSRTAGGLALLAMGLLLNAHFISLLLFGAALSMLDVGRLAGTRPMPGSVLLVLVVVALFLGTVPFSAARGPWWDAFVAMAPQVAIDGPWRDLPGFRPMRSEAAWHGLGAILLLIAVENSTLARRVLDAPPLRFLGTISFPLYLLHIPLLFTAGCGVFLTLMHAGASYGSAVSSAIVIYVGISLLAATMAVRLIERPAIGLAARLAQTTEHLTSGLRRRPPTNAGRNLRRNPLSDTRDAPLPSAVIDRQ